MDKEFSKTDRKLMGILSELLIPTKNIAAIMCICKSQKKRKKLYNFIMDNIEYVTESTILQMATALDKGREQIIPYGVIVKYIGEDDGEVTNGNLYEVGMIYGGGETYKITTDKRHIREYPAKLFVEQQATEIEIGYLENPLDGEELEGLELKKTYKVVGREGRFVILDNGCKCEEFRGDGVEFEDKPKKKIKPLDKKELLYRYMIFSRFNNSSHIHNYIREDCEYESHWSGTKLNGKSEIIERARMIFKNCVDQDVFYHMNTGIICKTFDEKVLPLDTPCFGVWEKGQLQSIATVDVDEEGYIYKINYFSQCGISILPDSIKTNYIEIIDGHDSGGCFWFKPCNIDITDNKGKKDYWEQVMSAENEISVDEIYFDDFLAYFFLQEFEEELEANKIRYDSELDRIKGFGWNLDYNFFTVEQVKKVVDKIWNFAIDMESIAREEIAKKHPILETKYCKPIDIIKNAYNNVNHNPCAVHDFYLRFTSKVMGMIEKNPDMKYFSVMGP